MTEDKIITYDVVNPVTVRKYEVDTDGLKKLLRDALQKSGLSKKDVAEKLNVPQTEAEHWFRNDTYFSVPNADVWFELKTLLGIDTDEFDLQITEFVEQDCTYDIRNRIYDSRGLMPTITNTMADKTILDAAQRKYAVRRLTPRETERLQGLPDDWTLIDHKSCCDSARYKAVGNGHAQPISDWLIKRIVEEMENAEMETEPGDA